MQLGLNHFADLTREEYRHYLGYRADLAAEKPLQTAPFRYESSKPPVSIDWREKGAVTSVKNQEQVRCLLHLLLLAGSFLFKDIKQCAVLNCDQAVTSMEFRLPWSQRTLLLRPLLVSPQCSHLLPQEIYCACHLHFAPLTFTLFPLCTAEDKSPGVCTACHCTCICNSTAQALLYSYQLVLWSVS